MAYEGSRQPKDNTTDQILRFIEENPSCHLRKIKKELDLAMGTVQYHLDRLEKAGRITYQKQGLHKHYFLVGAFEENEKQLLEVLSNETAREILMFIIEQKYPSQSEISKHIAISSPSVSWQIKRLQDYGVIEEIREGKFKRYKLHGDSKKFVALLKNYYPGIWNRWSSRLAEIFLSLSQGADQS
ncbi:MAG: winged helix-turn-helix transcriptional regulator [Thermoproteota archaeon]|nr:winged helix-turn-helix transcriptional regulator [Thermoproteota archaeon]